MARWLWNAVDIDPQKALPADFPFDVNNLQAFRARHPLGGFPNFLENHAGTPRPSTNRRALQPAATKKWACAHSPCDPLQSEDRVYSGDTAKARYGGGSKTRLTSAFLALYNGLFPHGRRYKVNFNGEPTTNIDPSEEKAVHDCSSAGSLAAASAIASPLSTE